MYCPLIQRRADVKYDEKSPQFAFNSNNKILVSESLTEYFSFNREIIKYNFNLIDNFNNNHFTDDFIKSSIVIAKEKK